MKRSTKEKDNGQARRSREAGIRQEMLMRSGYEEEKCPNYATTKRTPAQAWVLQMITSKQRSEIAENANCARFAKTKKSRQPHD
jgi:hypothetical protein